MSGMTDRSADAAREVIRERVMHSRNYVLKAEVASSYADEIIAALAAAGFEIRERRSEPVVEISVEGATEACDCVRILWESRGQHSPSGMRTEKALQELQSALVRATGDGETT
jgi:hypothetical protein